MSGAYFSDRAGARFPGKRPLFRTPQTLWEIFDDLISDATNNTSVMSSFCATASGAGSTIIHQAGTRANPGQGRIRTGTTAVGRCSLSTQLSDGDVTIALGTGTFDFFESVTKIATAPDGVEDFDAWLGFKDNITVAPTNGAFFLVDRAISAANILAATIGGGGGLSTTDTGIAIASASFRNFRIEVAGLVCDYFIDRVRVATKSLSGALTTGIGVGILKSLGTTPRELITDYIHAGGLLMPGAR